MAVAGANRYCRRTTHDRRGAYSSDRFIGTYCFTWRKHRFADSHSGRRAVIFKYVRAVIRYCICSERLNHTFKLGFIRFRRRHQDNVLAVSIFTFDSAAAEHVSKLPSVCPIRTHDSQFHRFISGYLPAMAHQHVFCRVKKLCDPFKLFRISARKIRIAEVKRTENEI